MKYENKPCSEFGKSIKKTLIDTDKNQNWLLSELRERLPDMYIDGSVLYKIITGSVTGGRVVEEIKKILVI